MAGIACVKNTWGEAVGGLIERCDISGPGMMGISGSDTTIRACNIHHLNDGVRPGEGNVLLEWCWIHHLGGDHVDGIQLLGAQNVIIRNCRFDCAPGTATAAVNGITRGTVIENCYIDGHLHFAAEGGWKVIGNTFKRGSNPKMYHYDKNQGEWRDNKWDDGTPCPA